MPSDTRDHNPDSIPTSYISPRKPPRKKLFARLFVPAGALGVIVVLASFFFEDQEATKLSGHKYTSGNITWQSIEPEWSTMWGEYALDMKVNPIRIHGSSETTFDIDGALMRALCGSVLTQLPDPPVGITRKNIYRLGFRFFRADDQSPTDNFPVMVQDGACIAYDDQLIFDWSYPGHLAGWSPVRYEGPDTEKLIVFFARRGDVRVPYDQVDLKLACEALFVESTDNMRDVLADVKQLEIRAVKGVVSPVFWAGAYQSQTFQIINKTCHPMRQAIDG